MKDAGQKDMLYRHFRAQGWFSLVEVAVAPRGGGAEKDKLITDIDVFALRPTAELTWEVVVGDCKTRRSESPANRALWVRAVMQYVNASRGYLLLKRESGKIEPDHKLMADQLGVTLLEEQEFVAFDRAMLYPRSSGRFAGETATQLAAFHAELQHRFQRMAEFVRYLSCGAWSERDHFHILRQVLGRADAIRSEIDPSKNLHVALVFEAAAVFGVALATCVGRMFHQFVATSNRNALEDGLRTMLWGGRERYESVVALRAQLVHGGVSREQPEALGVPQWAKFVQLVRSGMDAPRLMFRVPLLLRALAMEEVEATPRAPRGADPMLLKLALSTATYFSEACRLPQEMTEKISAALLARIARSVELRRGPAEDSSAGSGNDGGSGETESAEPSDERHLQLPSGTKRVAPAGPITAANLAGGNNMANEIAKAANVLTHVSALYGPNRTPGSLEALGFHQLFQTGLRFKLANGGRVQSLELIRLLGESAQQAGYPVAHSEAGIVVGMPARPMAPLELGLADGGDTSEKLAVGACANGDIAMGAVGNGLVLDAERCVGRPDSESIDGLEGLARAAARGIEAILEMANPPRIAGRS